MKYAFALVLILVSAESFARDSVVRGYTRSNGTYVGSHHRTTPDRTVNNNYGTSGNLNPYNGTSGTRERNYSQGNGISNPGNGLGSQRAYKNPYQMGSNE